MLITVHRTNLLTASSITLVLIGLLQPALAPGAWAGDASAELKSIRKTCGKCPDGYATTGVTEAPELCKDGDPTMTQCVPLGAGLRILSRRVSRSRPFIRAGTLWKPGRRTARAVSIGDHGTTSP
jgi:hypothetical protein